MFFFFKQKTAYEMRISDWSSDVCSSDLQGAEHQRRKDTEQQVQREPVGPLVAAEPDQGAPEARPVDHADGQDGAELDDDLEDLARRAAETEQDRKSTRLNSSH